MLVILWVAGPIQEGLLHYVWSMRPVLGDKGLRGTSVRTPEQGYSEFDAASGCYPPAGTLKFSYAVSGLFSDFSA